MELWFVVHHDFKKYDDFSSTNLFLPHDEMKILSLNKNLKTILLGVFANEL